MLASDNFMKFVTRVLEVLWAKTARKTATIKQNSQRSMNAGKESFVGIYEPILTYFIV